MKSLLISCLLIIFSNSHIYAESNESEDYDDTCYDQLIYQSRLESACVDKVLNQTEFLYDLTTSLIEYSGDDEDVRTQSDKYCPKLYQVVECTLVGYDIDEDCLSPAAHAKNRQSYDLTQTLLNYVCANRSQVIIQMLQYNGLDTIYDNKKVMKCLRPLDGLQSIDQATHRPSLKFCNGVNKAFACYARMVRDHKNKNLVRIAGELRDLHLQLLKCQSANQV